MVPRSYKRRPPLSPAQCRRMAKRCLKKGGYRFGKAPDVVRTLMLERDLTVNDLLNVLRTNQAKVKAEWESEFEEWRYAIQTERVKVLVTFETPERVVLITFWRLKKR